MSYYAQGLKDLLKTTELNYEFFESLSDFQLHFIEMCFRKSHDENIGLMTEIEARNLQIFSDFKLYKFEKDFGLDEDIWKKSA